MISAGGEEPVIGFGIVRYQIDTEMSIPPLPAPRKTLWRIIGNHFHLTGWHLASAQPGLSSGAAQVGKSCRKVRIPQTFNGVA